MCVSCFLHWLFGLNCGRGNERGGGRKTKKKTPPPLLARARKAFQEEGKECDSPVPGGGALTCCSGSPGRSARPPAPAQRDALLRLPGRSPIHSFIPVYPAEPVIHLLQSDSFRLGFFFPLCSPGSMLALSCLT